MSRSGKCFLKEEWKKLAKQLEGLEERPPAARAFVESQARPGDPESVLATLDDFALHHGFLINVGPVKGKLLEEEVESAGKALRILELGCFCGYSAILMAKHLEAAGRVVSVETNAVYVEAAAGIIDFAGLSGRIELIHGHSSRVIPDLDGFFDFVFLDHWKDLYTADLMAIEEAGLLRKGSVVFADNVGPLFDADAYLDYVRSCGHYETRHVVSTVEYTDLEDAAEISIYCGA